MAFKTTAGRLCSITIGHAFFKSSFGTGFFMCEPSKGIKCCSNPIEGFSLRVTSLHVSSCCLLMSIFLSQSLAKGVAILVCVGTNLLSHLECRQVQCHLAAAPALPQACPHRAPGRPEPPLCTLHAAHATPPCPDHSPPRFLQRSAFI